MLFKSVCPTGFRCALSDKKILPLCCKHVFETSSRKIRGEISLAYVFRRLFKAPKRYLKGTLLFKCRVVLALNH